MITCYLPPIRGTRNNHWQYICIHASDKSLWFCWQDMNLRESHHDSLQSSWLPSPPPLKWGAICTSNKKHSGTKTIGPQKNQTNQNQLSGIISHGTTVSFLREKSVPFSGSGWKEVIVQFLSPLDTQNSRRYSFNTIFFGIYIIFGCI